MMKLSILWQLSGANSLTQWYCAPAIGAMLAISAMLKRMGTKPIAHQTTDQTKLGSPPSMSAGVAAKKVSCHDDVAMTTNDSMLRKS